MSHHDDHPTRVPMPGSHLTGLGSRRVFLRSLVMGAGGLVLAACSPGPSVSDGQLPNEALPATPADPSSLSVGDFGSSATCTPTPTSTAGPFPLAEQLVRRDVTEGVAGHPIQLGFRVVDDTCAPLPGAAVEIWHTDATGDYSAFADGGTGKDDGPGTTFCRGTQIADTDGIVEFLTIHPGWYPGRAVHIHLRVHVDEATALTAQVVFPPDVTEQIFATGAYAGFGQADTPLTRDLLRDQFASGDITLAVTPDVATPLGVGTRAVLQLGVDLS